MSDGLRSLEVLKNAQESVDGQADALVLFGSAARGESDDLSDIDILQIGGTDVRRYRRGRLEFSVYTRHELLKIAELGSLFAAHLAMEAVALRDPDDVLGEIRQAFVPPENYSSYRNDILLASRMVSEINLSKDISTKIVAGTSYFLVRSWVFSILFDSGTPCFSLKRAAGKLRMPQLLELRRRRALSDNSLAFLRLCNQVLSSLMDQSVENPNETIEAAIVALFSNSDLAVALGLRVLTGASVALPYEDIGIWNHDALQ